MRAPYSRVRFLVASAAVVAVVSGLLALGFVGTANASVLYTVSTMAAAPSPSTANLHADSNVLAVNGAAHQLWVANYNAGLGSTVQSLDTLTGKYVGTPIAVSPPSTSKAGAAPVDVAVDSAASLVYVLTSDDQLTVINSTTRQIVHSVSIPAAADALGVGYLSVDPARHVVYALELDENDAGTTPVRDYTIWTINGITGATSSSPYVSPPASEGRSNSDLYGLVYDITSRQLYGLAGTGIVVIDPSTATATSTIEPDAQFDSEVIDSATGTIYAMTSPSAPTHEFVAINPLTNSVSTSYSVNTGTYELAGVTGTTNPVFYLSDPGDVIDGRAPSSAILSGSAVTKISTSYELSLAIDPATHIGYAIRASDGATLRISSPVVPSFRLRARPVISGSANVGGTLSTSTGRWLPAGTSFTYAWYRGATPIAGATKSRYKLNAADLGAQIHVVVTAHQAGYSATAATSSPTAPVG